MTKKIEKITSQVIWRLFLMEPDFTVDSICNLALTVATSALSTTSSAAPTAKVQ
jgi:hypothetical protein